MPFITKTNGVIQSFQRFHEKFIRQKHAAKIFHTTFPAGLYLFKVNNRNTRTMCEICSKLQRKTPERHHTPRGFLTFSGGV